MSTEATASMLSARREDELAIRDLANRYARLVDRRDYAEIPRVFTPDCELWGTGYSMRGHAELEAGLRKIEMFSATLHCVINQVSHLDGDRGTGEFYCVANHIHERDGVPYKLDMGIRYDDRYVRTADGWRLARRILNLIWQQDLPLDLSVAALSAVAAPSPRARAGRKPAAKRAAARSARGPAKKAKKTAKGSARGRAKKTARTAGKARAKKSSKKSAKRAAR
jgi:ketosteroid isomerase-like protein